MRGESVETDELLLAGERIWNAERLFNLSAGFTRADDTLPARLLNEPVAAGPCAGHVVDLTPMLDEYYRCRGWDDRGVPTGDKLAELSPAAERPAVGGGGRPTGAMPVTHRGPRPRPRPPALISCEPTEGESSTCTES